MYTVYTSFWAVLLSTAQHGNTTRLWTAEDRKQRRNRCEAMAEAMADT